jgi:hypothetical protein
MYQVYTLLSSALRHVEEDGIGLTKAWLQVRCDGSCL